MSSVSSASRTDTAADTESSHTRKTDCSRTDTSVHTKSSTGEVTQTSADKLLAGNSAAMSSHESGVHDRTTVMADRGRENTNTDTTGSRDEPNVKDPCSSGSPSQIQNKGCGKENRQQESSVKAPGKDTTDKGQPSSATSVKEYLSTAVSGNKKVSVVSFKMFCEPISGLTNQQ